MLLFYGLAIDIYFNDYGIDFAIPLFSFVVMISTLAPLDIWFCTKKRGKQSQNIRLKGIALFWLVSTLVWYLIYAVTIVADIAGTGNYTGFFSGLFDVFPLIVIFIIPVIVFMLVSYMIANAYYSKKR